MSYYEILGISRIASIEEITKAYKKMSKLHHPDRGGDVEKCKQINEAYSKLKEDRAAYDRKLDEAKRGYTSSSVTEVKKINIAPIMMELNVTLEDIYNNYCIDIEINKFVCGMSEPTGFCSYCKNHGKNVKDMYRIMINSKDLNRPLVLSRRGDSCVTSTVQGDVHVKLNVQKHNFFERFGKQGLITKTQISAHEAKEGFMYDISFLDNTILRVVSKPRTIYQTGDRKVIPQKGLYLEGDLFVEIEVVEGTPLRIPLQKTYDEKVVLEDIYDQKKEAYDNESDSSNGCKQQ